MTDNIIEFNKDDFEKLMEKKSQVFESGHLTNVYCQHVYVIDLNSDIVGCTKCDSVFNPMYVLKKMADAESKWSSRKQYFENKVEALKAKTKIKCQHCGRFTKTRK